MQGLHRRGRLQQEVRPDPEAGLLGFTSTLSYYKTPHCPGQSTLTLTPTPSWTLIPDPPHTAPCQSTLTLTPSGTLTPNPSSASLPLARGLWPQPLSYSDRSFPPPSLSSGCTVNTWCLRSGLLADRKYHRLQTPMTPYPTDLRFTRTPSRSEAPFRTLLWAARVIRSATWS